MRRKLKTLRAKQGHNRDGNPSQMIDEMVYREHGAHVNTGATYGSEYSGWSWASRPRDQAISIRHHVARGTGASAPSGPS